jgi:hypothetical protein
MGWGARSGVVSDAAERRSEKRVVSICVYMCGVVFLFFLFLMCVCGVVFLFLSVFKMFNGEFGLLLPYPNTIVHLSAC